MQRRTEKIGSTEERTDRIAWWVAFLTTLVLVGLLSIVHSAQARPLAAAPTDAPFATVGFEEEGEEEPEAWEEELCEEDEEGEEWCEEEVEEVEDEASECILTSATARVSARPSRKRLELVVRYKGDRAAAVAISWRLRGAKGALSLGTERARFSRSGRYRHLELGLGRKRMAKALAAREFRIAVRAVNTPAHCRRDLESRLRARHSAPAGPYWTERSSRVASG